MCSNPGQFIEHFRHIAKATNLSRKSTEKDDFISATILFSSYCSVTVSLTLPEVCHTIDFVRITDSIILLLLLKIWPYGTKELPVKFERFFFLLIASCMVVLNDQEKKAKMWRLYPSCECAEKKGCGTVDFNLSNLRWLCIYIRIGRNLVNTYLYALFYFHALFLANNCLQTSSIRLKYE